MIVDVLLIVLILHNHSYSEHYQNLWITMSACPEKSQKSSICKSYYMFCKYNNMQLLLRNQSGHAVMLHHFFSFISYL